MSRALGAGVQVDEVLACRSLVGPDAAVLDRAAAAGAEVVEVTESVFGRLSLREGPDGVLGVARTFATGLDELDDLDDTDTDTDIDTETGAAGLVPLVLVVAEVEAPATSAPCCAPPPPPGPAVVVADPVTDVFNPQVVRASQGALFGVPVGVGDTPAAIAWLRRHGLRIYAAGPGAAGPTGGCRCRGPRAGGQVRAARAARRVVRGGRQRVVIPMPGSRASTRSTPPRPRPCCCSTPPVSGPRADRGPGAPSTTPPSTDRPGRSRPTRRGRGTRTTPHASNDSPPSSGRPTTTRARASGGSSE